MKADAPRRAEQEALEYAVNELHKLKDLLTPEGARRHWRKQHDRPTLLFGYDIFMKSGLPARALKVLTNWIVSARRGDGESIRQLRIFAAALLERGEAFPDPLRDFIVEYLREPKSEKKRTRGPVRYMQSRNVRIRRTIFLIVDKWKFPATRNPATTSSSAASIVRDALEVAGGDKLTEDAINKIWKALSKKEREAAIKIERDRQR